MNRAIKVLSLKSWDRPTRFLHAGMALTVSLQLFLSLIMRAPSPGRVLTFSQAITFKLHTWVGLSAIIIILIHFCWVVCNQTRRNHLFPWSKAGWQTIKRDIKQLLQFKLLPLGPRGGLPGIIHGLGLLSVVAMAITACFLFYIYVGQLLPASSPYWQHSGFLHFIKEAHETMATFVWIYWCGHLCMALLHAFFWRGKRA